MKKGRGGTSAAGVASNGVSPKNGAPRDISPESLGLDAETLVGYYRSMVQIRLFEDAAQRCFRRGKIGGYLHVYIGQEAVATGFLSTYKPGDRVITAYRDHAHAILLGADPKTVMAELFGKGTGLVKGKGGSMHLFDEPTA